MKILIFIHSLSAGGAERVTALLANHWASQGLRVAIVTLASRSLDRYSLNGAIERVELERAGTSQTAFAGLRANVERISALRRALTDQKPDIALAMMTNSNVLLALASIGLPVRTVGAERIHPPRMDLGLPWSILRAGAYGLLDAMVAQTVMTRDWIIAHTTARKVEVIPNPVAWPLERVPPVVEPDSIGDASRKRLLAVGRLVYQKGFDILIDVFSELAPRYPEWELVIIGQGPDRAALETRIESHSLGARVFLAGDVGNIGDWYESADMFVLSSRFEGFPNALAEAMAYGLPVVSFDCETGPRDLIEDRVSGLLVSAGDGAALGDGLAQLMGDESLRTQIGARAIGVRDRYTLSAVGDKWLALFRSLTDPQ
ncbi:MAG TPA: glycosyltransferase family 4 protein [Gemmatimonadaceae bacterium]|nr:glycosyltransferase family 4 protein [Gemmatimonadaceae bacterium]